MRNSIFSTLCIGGIFIVLISLHTCTPASESQGARFEVSFPDSLHQDVLTGRMFVALARTDEREPRLQVGRYGCQFFGVDFTALSPGESVIIDGDVLGYPYEALADVPAGAYFVQAVLSKYTKFERSDGHTLWMHMDQWEGQDWRRSPGNYFSEVMRVEFDPEKREVIRLVTDREIPKIEIPADTKWVKRIKMQSDLLTDFWGHPIFIGATVLLPKGYDENPDRKYPTVYHHGHFSLRPPLGFHDEDDNQMYKAWTSDDFPRFIAVTIQHPTPYFDDSYAVNSANNGPYGDAIHQELIPELERQFGMIAQPYARVLTGGSTGGWESFALQVFYPDFYGGTWSFAPDPLDFRNVEGINIYEDENAFYRDFEWYDVPIVNTINHRDGSVRLTSEQRNRMELVNGTEGRSGEQLDIWSAVFGPVGEDGYFKPLFDKRTGEIDPEVAQYWKEHYDIRHHLETNWTEILGSKLEGKLHLICGDLDNFQLNWGVYYTEEFLESTTDPYYNGSVTYGRRGGHGWRPYGYDELIRKMADHIHHNRPSGSRTSGWYE